jgi:isoquinoline 1-oxidoreductase beta subunit
VLQAEGDEKYGDQYTDGSRSVVKNFDRLRQFGAGARTMLEHAAAKSWGVDPADCQGRNHRVMNLKTNETLDYGELVAAAVELPVPAVEQVKLKPRDQWRYIGKPMPLVDMADITHGKAIFGIDVRLPGMKYASVQRCPVLLGTVKSYDASEALKMPGVEKVVEIPSAKQPVEFQALGGLAVVASNTWAANEGRKKLKIQWDVGPNTVYDSVMYQKTLEATAQKPGKIRRMDGDTQAAFA